MHRLRLLLPSFALMLVMAFHLVILLGWGENNHQFARGVCCGFARPVFQEIHRIFDWQAHSWTLDRGILPLLSAYWVLWFSGKSAALYWLSCMFLQLSMLWLFLICRYLRRPWSGVLSAALLPVLPAVAYAVRRWDVYVPQMSIVLAATYFLLRSRRFSKPLWSLLFFCMVIVAAFWSSRETDNLLLLAMLFSMAGCSAVTAVYRQRDVHNRHIKISHSLLSMFICGGITAMFLVENMHFFAPAGKEYYLSEVQQYAQVTQIDPWTNYRLAAYFSYIVDRATGPWISWVFLWIIPLWLLRKRPPVELFATLLPLLFLSLLAKKNHYYIATIWPFIALAIGMSLVAFPRKLRLPLAFYIIVVGFFPYMAKNDPDGAFAAYMGRRPWVNGGSGYYGLIQTSDGGLSLLPYRNAWADRAGQLLQKYSPDNGCHTKWMIIAYGILPVEEMQLRVLSSQPCVQIQNMPPMLQLPKAGMALLPQLDQYQEVDLQLRREGLAVVDTFTADDGVEVAIYRRPLAWFQSSAR